MNAKVIFGWGFLGIFTAWNLICAWRTEKIVFFRGEIVDGRMNPLIFRIAVVAHVLLFVISVGGICTGLRGLMD